MERLGYVVRLTFRREMTPMKIRRSILITATAVVALMAAGAGAYAYAGDDSSGGSASPSAPSPSTSVSDSADSPSPSAEATQPQDSESPQPTADHDCGKPGEYQEKVEGILDDLGGYGTVFVDGKQSKEDCAAIVKFQKRMGIQPAEGYAGEVTHRIAKRIKNSDLDKCDPGPARVVCIDLTHQTLWVTDVGEIVYGPTVIRSGMGGGYQTVTGEYQIANKAQQEWSKPYKVWLPYWQHFFDGQGLHETTTYLHDSFGSHGCVNLLHKDAVELFDMLEVGDSLTIFGHRPGT
jgi:lipoprotein-anchoring transpeptidase ErfK/SrfK